MSNLLRKGIVSLAVCCSVIGFTAVQATAASDTVLSSVPTTELQSKLTPEQVLDLLKAGNGRYTSGKSVNYNQQKLSADAGNQGQAPLAFIFGCVDSRVIPEDVFNQPSGTLFVSRIAGNVVSPDVLGSMEFATKYAGTKLIVVMGHSQCGAVVGACKGVDNPPNALKGLLAKIAPAIKKVQSEEGDSFSCSSDTTINAIIKQNVVDEVNALIQQSPALAQMVKDKKIAVVGAVNNIVSGKVTFFDAKGDEV